MWQAHLGFEESLQCDIYTAEKRLRGFIAMLNFSPVITRVSVAVTENPVERYI